MEEHYTEPKELPKKVYSAGSIAEPNEVVKEACEKWAQTRRMPKDAVIRVLQWDGLMGCYCFTWAGMFLGVETDGYIHT